MHNTLLLTAARKNIGLSSRTQRSIRTYCAAMKNTDHPGEEPQLVDPQLAERRLPGARQQRQAQGQQAQQQRMEQDAQRFQAVEQQRPEEEQAEAHDQDDRGRPQPLLEQRPQLRRHSEPPPATIRWSGRKLSRAGDPAGPGPAADSPRSCHANRAWRGYSPRWTGCARSPVMIDLGAHRRPSSDIAQTPGRHSRRDPTLASG